MEKWMAVLRSDANVRAILKCFFELCGPSSLKRKKRGREEFLEFLARKNS